MQATRQQQQLFFAALVISLIFWTGLCTLFYFELDNFKQYLLVHNIGWQLVLVPGLILLLISVVISAVIRIQKLAYLRGHAVELGANQFPDLHKRVLSVCKRLGVKTETHSYLLNNITGRTVNSLRASSRLHLVLPADIVGILTDRQGSIDFIIGQEIARLSAPYSQWRWLLWPTTVIPLLSAARQRAEIYWRDSNALTACKSQVDAALALATSVAGDPRWKSLNIPEFNKQSATISGFTMSLAELLSDRPWAPKRMANLRALATKSDAFIPRYHPLSYLVAGLFPFIQPLKLIFLSQILALALWTGLAGYWLPIAKIKIDQQIELRWPAKEENASVAKKSKVAQSTTKNKKPYARIHQDLKKLGREIRRKNSKKQDNPCELANAHQLKLNYPASRYAFDCDKPVVYTHIEQGEFIPGKTAHLQRYNWKKKRILKSK